MKLVSSLFAAAAVFCAGVMMLDAAVAQQDSSAQQKQKGDANVAPTNEFKQRTFAPGNFRLQPEGENEAMVDGLEEKQSVATDHLGEARDLQIAPAPASAPPRVTFTWGDERPPPGSVLEEMGSNYTMFHTDGGPVRATTDIDVSEAGNAKQKQRTPEEEEEEDEDKDE